MTYQPSISFPDYLRQGDPLVSIVITSFNKGRFLRETVGSFLSQTYQNLEILIVNDGSTDDTSGVTQELIRDNPRHIIKLFDKSNGGVSDARNHGFRNASGRVVMTMDGDDMARPNYLASAVEAMRSKGANLFTAAQEHFGLESRCWNPPAYDKYSIRYESCFPTPAVFDRELWVKSGGFNVGLGYAEDWEFWVGCSKYDLNPAKSTDPLTLYRMNEDGIASTYINDRHQECQTVVTIVDDDLYPVEEVLQAQDYFPKSPEKNKRRIHELLKIHRNEWVGNFLAGLDAEASGQLQEAVNFYQHAIDCAPEPKWQPALRLGKAALENNLKNEALWLLHLVRTLRPDTSRYVNPLIAAAVQG
jgi:glycosyltransferase involved in cell wall biosynthesis